jgi:hypothetical protein
MAAGWPDALAGRSPWSGPEAPQGRSEGAPDVLFEAGQIQPRDADGDCEGGPAEEMETG